MADMLYPPGEFKKQRELAKKDYIIIDEIDDQLTNDLGEIEMYLEEFKERVSEQKDIEEHMNAIFEKSK